MKIINCFLKVIFVTTLLSLVLAGCYEKQQKTEVVKQKETAKDFTVQGGTTQRVKKAVPDLPGKAQVPGAPISEATTTTGTATVLPQGTNSAPAAATPPPAAAATPPPAAAPAPSPAAAPPTAAAPSVPTPPAPTTP